MVGHRTPPAPVDADRLGRVADMVNDAVALLNQAISEIKNERGPVDDGDASGEPDGDTEQPGRPGRRSD